MRIGGGRGAGEVKLSRRAATVLGAAELTGAAATVAIAVVLWRRLGRGGNQPQGRDRPRVGARLAEAG